MFFGKKKEGIFAPVNGEMISLEQVNDPVFSSKALGDGFGVEPTENRVYSPISGKVVSIFPTKHAILLETKNGQPVLLHIGIDTVELNGEGIEVTANSGQKVTKETLLAEVDFKLIKSLGKQATVIVAFEGIESLELKSNIAIQSKQFLGNL